MTIHVYECEEHGQFETFRHMGDDDLGSNPCPSCSRTSAKVWNAGTTGVTHVFKSRYCEQLGAEITSRSREKEVIKQLFESSQGATAMEWR